MPIRKDPQMDPGLHLGREGYCLDQDSNLSKQWRFVQTLANFDRLNLCQIYTMNRPVRFVGHSSCRYWIMVQNKLSNLERTGFGALVALLISPIIAHGLWRPMVHALGLSGSA